jgi:UDP-N-acetylglucosamine--N-acetylmuramyl-(pentapeptide) pyrophosphoryl-undecaprenol N-acetylglucosamine transferase
MGGSQGAAAINNVIWDNLEKLLGMKQIIHICGKGNLKSDQEIRALLGKNNESFFRRYKAYEFFWSGMQDLYALSDLIVSRAGAITLAELSVVKKPAILIPLGTEASRGDQIDNAKAYINTHNGVVMKEEDFDINMFLKSMSDLLSDQLETKKHLEVNNLSAAEKIISLFEEL